MSKELFEKQLIKTLRHLISEHDRCSDNEELAEIASMEISSMGNFTDPESNKQYGYKFVIGKPDFHKDDPAEDDEF